MSTQLLENYPLVNIAGRSFVLLVITFGVALACRRRSAAVIHRIWALGFFGCLAIAAACVSDNLQIVARIVPHAHIVLFLLM